MSIIKKIEKQLRVNKTYLLALLLISPMLTTLLIFNYQSTVSPDESFQLQTAKRFAENKGFTYSIGFIHEQAIPDNLNEENYGFMSRWPFGLSVLVSLFLVIGLSTNQSIVIIKIIFVLLGLFYWIKFSQNFLKNNWTHELIFITYITLLAYNLFGPTSDLICWALSPIIFHYIIIKSPHRLKNIVKASILASIIIFIKYSFWAILPIGVLFYIFRYYDNFNKMIKSSLTYSILPILSIILVFYINSLGQFQETDVQKVSVINLFNNMNIEWLFYIFSSLTIDPIKITPIILKMNNIFNLNLFEVMKFGISTLIIFGIIYIFYKALHHKKYNNDIYMLTISAIIGLVVFIIFVNTIHNPSNPSLNSTRYYHPILPLIPITILYYFDKKNFNITSFTNKIINGIILLIFLAFIFIWTVRTVQDLTWHENHKERVTNFIENITSESETKSLIIATKNFPWFLQNEKYITYRSFEMLSDKDKFFEKPMFIFVIENKNQVRESYKEKVLTENKRKRSYFNKYKHNLDKYSFNDNQIGDLIIHWKKFDEKPNFE